MIAAPSAKLILAQANSAYPNRRRTSDGIFPDLSHLQRVSDHNPGPVTGYCHATDLSHDPASCNCGPIAEAIVAAARAGKEPRVTYVIFNRRIASEARDWVWRTYTGVSPHTEHMHISIRDTFPACEDTRPWPGIGGDVLDYYVLTLVAETAEALALAQAECAKLGIKAAACGYALECHANPIKAEALQAWVRATPDIGSFKGVPTTALTASSVAVMEPAAAPVPAASAEDLAKVRDQLARIRAITGEV